MKKRKILSVALTLISLSAFCQTIHSIYQEGNFYGIKNQDNEIILPPNKYTKIFKLNKEDFTSFFADSILIAKIDDKYGVIDWWGKEIIKSEFEKIYALGSQTEGDFFKVRNDGKFGLFTSKGELIIPIIFDRIDIVEGKGRIPYVEVISKDDSGLKTGVYDFNGYEIVPPENYNIILQLKDKVGNDSITYYKVKSKNSNGIYDIEGNCLVPLGNYQYLRLIKDKRAANGLAVIASEEFIPIGNDHVVILEAKTLRVIEDSKDNEDVERFVTKANIFFKEKEYKNSAKEYTNAINIREEDYTLFSRGACYYNLGKYKKAQQDFERCYQITDDKDIMARCEEIIPKTIKHREEARQENLNIALALTGAALVTAGTIMSSNSNSGSSNNSASGGNVGTYSGGSSSGGGSYSSSSSSSSQASRCGLCGGRGSTIEYTSNYGISKKEYCSQCGKDMMANHYHKTCQLCHGKGYK